MADLATNLQRLQNNSTAIANATTAIANAIITKGGTVTSGDGLDDFASDIATITTAKLTTKTITENGIYNATDETTVKTDTNISFPHIITTNSSKLNNYILKGNVDTSTTPTTYVGDAISPISGSTITDLNGQYELNYPISSWSEVRDIVRAGKAPLVFPIGSLIVDDLSNNTDNDNRTIFQVVGYNNHFDPNLLGHGYYNSMTLCEWVMKPACVFCDRDATMYIEYQQMPAGNYSITTPTGYDNDHGGNGTVYYFTTTKVIPVGGQLLFNWASNTNPSNITTYETQTSTTVLETVTISTTATSGVTYKDLGVMPYTTPYSFTTDNIWGPINQVQRFRYGSNNYYQSPLRQLLNATTAGNTWWTPQTVFNRPYTSRTTNGRLYVYNQDLVNILGKPQIKSRTNTYFEYPSIDGTTFTVNTDYIINTDKVFLLSPMEVGFTGYETTIGTKLDYYSNTATGSAADTKRIKKYKSNNSAGYWWLRTPYPSGAISVRYVNTSGALGSGHASNSYGVAAACIIQ